MKRPTLQSFAAHRKPSDIVSSDRAKANPWRPWQFSLRTLLVVILAMACFLGGWIANDWQQLKKSRPVAQVPTLDTYIKTPDVEGSVTDVSEKGYVLISVGKEDGVRRGMKFHVYYGSTYRGRIEVVKTKPKTALARIRDEETREAILRGDRIATSIR